MSPTLGFWLIGHLHLILKLTCRLGVSLDQCVSDSLSYQHGQLRSNKLVWISKLRITLKSILSCSHLPCLFNLQVLALVGDQLDYGDNICGAVLSIRFSEDILSVWNRNASDHQVCILNSISVLYSYVGNLYDIYFRIGCRLWWH